LRPLPNLLYRLNTLRWRITRPVTLGVRLILTQGDTVLLVKHTYQRDWYLPGGGIQRGETPEQAARREAAEEVGGRLGALHLWGLYTNFYEHKSDHVVVFTSDDVVVTGRTDREIERYAFYSFDRLPDDLSPGSRRRLCEFAGGAATPILGMW
jgi:8-oxo-dGTP pyrophosphatase MutT (NUDIX family)